MPIFVILTIIYFISFILWLYIFIFYIFTFFLPFTFSFISGKILFNLMIALFFFVPFSFNFSSRQEREITQRNLFEKAHFATFLRESFLPFPTNSDDLPDKTASEETANKFVARGLIMNCANAIRLQVNMVQLNCSCDLLNL